MGNELGITDLISDAINFNMGAVVGIQSYDFYSVTLNVTANRITQPVYAKERDKLVTVKLQATNYLEHYSATKLHDHYATIANLNLLLEVLQVRQYSNLS